MKDSLASISVEFGDKWDDALQSVTFAYNTSVHEATGYTPYYVLYGREANVPGDALAMTAADNDRDGKVPMYQYVQFMIDGMARAQKFIQGLMDSKRNDNIADRLKFARIPVYHVGDQVYVRDPLSDLQTGGGHGKRVPPFVGPYTVVRRAGEFAYEVMPTNRKKSDRLSMVNVDRMKPYTPTDPNSMETDEPSSLPGAGRTESFRPPSVSRTPAIKTPKYRSGFGSADSSIDDEHLHNAAALAAVAAVTDDEPTFHTSMDIDPIAATSSSSASSSNDIDITSTDPTPSISLSPSSLLPHTGGGPSDSARRRHASRAQPMYSDEFLARFPANPQSRYSISSSTHQPVEGGHPSFPSDSSRKKKKTLKK